MYIYIYRERENNKNRNIYIYIYILVRSDFLRTVNQKLCGHFSSLLSFPQVPKFTVLIGGSFGAGNYGMCGRSFR